MMEPQWKVVRRWTGPVLMMILISAITLTTSFAWGDPFEQWIELVSPNEEFNGAFGAFVSGVPDVDGDGRGDVIVAAPHEDPGGLSNAGRAYIFSGATGVPLHTLVSPNGQSGGMFGGPGDGLGYQFVSGIPDVDGDGRGDVIVATTREDPNSAYIFSGATGAPLHTLVSPTGGVKFGHHVSGVPDVDGDGRGDVIVGAPYEVAYRGRAHIFSGATGALLRTLISPNEEDDGFFGQGVSGIADVDGDGRGDVLVGAEYEDPGASPDDAGRAYLFSGATGTLLHTFVSPSEQAGGYFGFRPMAVPDVNGDGRDDVGVIAWGEGRAYIFSGATRQLLLTLTPAVLSSDTRWSGVPDADGDGRGDVVFGNRYVSPPEAQAVIYSGATGTLLSSLGPVPGSGPSFGFSVSGIEDVNGDGRGDVIVGDFEEDRAYIFLSEPVTAVDVNHWRFYE